MKLWIHYDGYWTGSDVIFLSAEDSIAIVRDITFHKSWMDYFVKEITSSMIP